MGAAFDDGRGSRGDACGILLTGHYRAAAFHLPLVGAGNHSSGRIRDTNQEEVAGSDRGHFLDDGPFRNRHVVLSQNKLRRNF